MKVTLWILKDWVHSCRVGVICSFSVILGGFWWYFKIVGHTDITNMKICVAISRESASGSLILMYSQKKESISFVFYCFENPLLAITLAPLVRFRRGLSTQCTSSNEHLNQIETEDVTFDFRLISLDRITYIEVHRPSWHSLWLYLQNSRTYIILT